MGLSLILIALLFPAPLRYDNATLLDVARYRDRVYVCAATRDRIVIAEKRDGRIAERVAPLAGKPLRAAFNASSLWIVARDGHRVRFHQDYLTRAFPPHSQCEQIVDAAIARRDSDTPKTLLRR